MREKEKRENRHELNLSVAVKREKVFKPVEEARLQRLAEAQAEAAKKAKVGDVMEEEEVKGEMEVDEEVKKISTSGPRSNRHARKLKEKKNKGKKSALKF